MGDMDVGGVEAGGSVAECALAALLDEGVPQSCSTQGRAPLFLEKVTSPVL